MSGAMFAHTLILFALQFIWTHVVQTLQAPPCTLSAYSWSYNSKQDTPCDVAVNLFAICYGTGVYLDPLTPLDDYYIGPPKGNDSLCACSTVTWGLIAACGICQNGSAVSWSSWAYNCSESSVTVERFPLSIPAGVDVPHWAYLKVGDDGYWNSTAARLDAQNPPRPSKTNIGAIVGGVVGGVVALAIAMILCVIIRRRRHRKAAGKPPPPSYESEGGNTLQPTATPSFITEYSTPQKLYDPSDPSTFPSPGNYDGWGAANTSPTGAPENDRTIIY